MLKNGPFVFPGEGAKTEIVGAPELYVKSGSPLRLECAIRNNTEQPSYVFWYHGASSDGLMNHQASRGVRVENGEHSSVLHVPRVTSSDGGNYTCLPSNAPPAFVLVHVLKGLPSFAIPLVSTFFHSRRKNRSFLRGKLRRIERNIRCGESEMTHLILFPNDPSLLFRLIVIAGLSMSDAFDTSYIKYLCALHITCRWRRRTQAPPPPPLRPSIRSITPHCPRLLLLPLSIMINLSGCGAS